MDIQKELQETTQKRAQLVKEINQLDQQRQIRLQEALRLDGEIRALERLTKQKDGQTKSDRKV